MTKIYIISFFFFFFSYQAVFSSIYLCAYYYVLQINPGSTQASATQYIDAQNQGYNSSSANTQVPHQLPHNLCSWSHIWWSCGEHVLYKVAQMSEILKYEYLHAPQFLKLNVKQVSVKISSHNQQKAHYSNSSFASSFSQPTFTRNPHSFKESSGEHNMHKGPMYHLQLKSISCESRRMIVNGPHYSSGH